MKINVGMLKSALRSWSMQIYGWLGIVSTAYLALPTESQLAIYAVVQPYLPSGGLLGLAVSVLGIILRAKTTKPLSER